MKKAISIFILFSILFTFKSFGQTNYEGVAISVWSIKVGYFPNYNNAFVSEGMAFNILNENINENEIGLGYYFSLLSAFEKRDIEDYSGSLEGSFSAGFFLNYNRSIKKKIH